MVVKSARRRFGAGALALIAALLLSGCSSDSARGDFAATFGPDDAIAEFELSTADNMPFTDGVSAEVWAKDDVGPEQLQALVQRLSVFASGHPDSPVRITLVADGVTVPVFRDADLSAEVISSALEILADERVTSVELTAASDGDNVTGASLEVQAAAGAIAAFELARLAPERLADVQRMPLHITVRATDGSVRIQGAAGSWIDDAESAWVSMSSAVPAVGLSAEPGRLEVKLADERDVPAASAARDGVGSELAIVFSSPLVSLGKNATGDTARALLGALGQEHAVGSLWTDDDQVNFWVADDTAASSIAEAVSALPESLEFSTLSIGVGSPDVPTLLVRTSPSQLGDRVSGAVELLADADVQSLNITPRSATLTMTTEVSEADLAKRLEALRQLAEPDARVCAVTAGGSTVCDDDAR